VISRSIAEYLVQAWDVRNNCKHNGAVLPLSSLLRGVGPMALMLWLNGYHDDDEGLWTFCVLILCVVS
jgi:hypothetical protein